MCQRGIKDRVPVCHRAQDERAQLAPQCSPRDTALFAPIHYEPGYAYPLVVWLHGEGSSERELRQVMPRVSVTASVTPAICRWLCSQSGDSLTSSSLRNA